MNSSRPARAYSDPRRTEGWLRDGCVANCAAKIFGRDGLRCLSTVLQYDMMYITSFFKRILLETMFSIRKINLVSFVLLFSTCFVWRAGSPHILVWLRAIFLERQSISNATSAFLRKICELSDGKRVWESVATCSGVCFKSG